MGNWRYHVNRRAAKAGSQVTEKPLNRRLRTTLRCFSSRPKDLEIRQERNTQERSQLKLETDRDGKGPSLQGMRTDPMESTFKRTSPTMVFIPAARVTSPSWAVDWLPEAAAGAESQSDWDSQTLSLSQELPENKVEGLIILKILKHKEQACATKNKRYFKKYKCGKSEHLFKKLATVKIEQKNACWLVAQTSWHRRNYAA